MPKHINPKPTKTYLTTDNTANPVATVPTPPTSSELSANSTNRVFVVSHSPSQLKPKSSPTRHGQGILPISREKFRLRPLPILVSPSLARDGVTSYTIRSIPKIEEVNVLRTLSTSISATKARQNDKQNVTRRETKSKEEAKRVVYFTGDGVGGVFLDERVMQTRRRLFGVHDEAGAR